MPIDMKAQIAAAAQKLLFEENVKKLTVKDIVDECSITRQSFYYHFEDIPHLLEWMLHQGMEQMKAEAMERSGIRERLEYFFKMSIQLQPYIKKTLGSNYGQELKLLLKHELTELAKDAASSEQLYTHLSYEELDILIRYHSQAILGILMDWDAEDQKNMDGIIDMIYRILCGSITLKEQE